MRSGMPWTFPTRLLRNFQEHRMYHLIAYADPVLPLDAPAEVDPHVTLDAVIGQDGIIMELGPKSGDPSLMPAALETVRHWTFRPLKLNGIPVEVKTEIEVTFQPRNA